MVVDAVMHVAIADMVAVGAVVIVAGVVLALVIVGVLVVGVIVVIVMLGLVVMIFVGHMIIAVIVMFCMISVIVAMIIVPFLTMGMAAEAQMRALDLDQGDGADVGGQRLGRLFDPGRLRRADPEKQVTVGQRVRLGRAHLVTMRGAAGRQEQVGFAHALHHLGHQRMDGRDVGDDAGDLGQGEAGQGCAEGGGGEEGAHVDLTSFVTR